MAAREDARAAAWETRQIVDEQVASLRSSIVYKPPWLGCVLHLSPSCFSLFYKVSKEDRAARYIDLANASPEELEQLSQACERATFGRDQEDVMDESYRKARKMDPSCFSTPLIPDHTQLMDAVRGYLLEGSHATRKIEVELYKLNVYGKGSFFKPHVDTPRNERMFGSLVVVFPTPHEGGDLVFSSRNLNWTLSSSQKLTGAPAHTICYAAFFSDVQHAVRPVTSGHRVTLTYNLYFGDDGPRNDKRGETTPSDTTLTTAPAPARPPSFVEPPNERRFRKAFQKLLDDPEFLPDGGTLGFGLRHAYQVEDDLKHVYSLLKGSDAVAYNVARDLGFEPVLYLYYRSKVVYGGIVDALSEKPIKLGRGEQVEDLSRRIRYEGGLLIRNSSEFSDYDGDETKEWIFWVTKLTADLNRKETAFLAYGNEASMGMAYSYVCLIVRIGKAGDRKAYRTVAQLKQQWEDARKEKRIWHGLG
ncbi:hypothetical protein BC834DRAFT_974667 [Gloeopeniophorella convolvens]|nr:hypothetical protein BC834DRAFT_974667 [Gloeopeniophorella convolvens]